MQAQSTTPAGWYPDPWGQSSYRWWDGHQWTPWVHPPASTAVAPKAAHLPSTFAAPASIAILFGTLVSILAATWVGDELEFKENWHGVVVVYTVLFGTMALWAVLLSRRLGSGTLGADFGFRIKAEDIGWGTLAFIATMLARVLVLYALPEESRDPLEDVDRALRLDRGALVAFAFAALIGAPIVEELVFRGVLQRALTKVFGPPLAIGLQAILFASYHFVPSTGRFTLLYFVSLALFGVAAGIAAEYTGRLGPAMVAHLLNNALAVLVLAVT